MISFLKTAVYIPLYNILIFILSILPWPDIGLAVIIMTLLVRILLYPLSKSASVMQVQMKKHQAELDEIKIKYKDSKEQALKVMEFYKRYKINPFSSFLTVLIQIPIIYSLYYMFVQAGLPAVDQSLLYHFTPHIQTVSTNFLGLFDISEKNILLALIAGLSGFFQIKLSAANPSQLKPGVKPEGIKGDLAAAMSTQMKYVFPVIIFLISWKTSGVLALYWLISNCLSILQDWHVRRRFSR